MDSKDKALCIVMVIAILTIGGCIGVGDYARYKYQCVESKGE